MRALGWLIDRIGRDEGSTRTVALFRIGMPLIAWVRYGSSFTLFKKLDPEYAFLGLNFWLSTLLLLFGVASRFSAAWAGATLMGGVYFWLGFEKGVEPFTHHHTYLIGMATCLLVFTPCGRSLSFDRWWALRREARGGRPAPPERGALWGQRLIAFQIAMIYLWGAYDKCHAAYMSGERFEHYLMYLYLGSRYPKWEGFPYLADFLAWSSIIYEYLLAVGLWFRRLQPWLIPSAIVFHAVIYYSFPVATYSVTMWLLLLSFIHPDAVHRFLDDMLGRPR